MTSDYQRIYNKGYTAGARCRWQEYRPPHPPQEQVRALFVAAQELSDAAHDVLSSIIPDEPIFLALKSKLEATDAAFIKISEWLKATP